jgi:hypothetical protein
MGVSNSNVGRAEVAEAISSVVALDANRVGGASMTASATTRFNVVVAAEVAPPGCVGGTACPALESSGQPRFVPPLSGTLPTLGPLPPAEAVSGHPSPETVADTVISSPSFDVGV